MLYNREQTSKMDYLNESLLPFNDWLGTPHIQVMLHFSWEVT